MTGGSRHKDVYERDVREPMLALLDALEDEFGAAQALPAQP